MNHRPQNDSSTRAIECIQDARRYLKKRGITPTLLEIRLQEKPIIAIRNQAGLNRLEERKLIGVRDGLVQYGVFLKSLTLIWEFPQPIQWRHCNGD